MTEAVVPLPQIEPPTSKHIAAAQLAGIVSAGVVLLALLCLMNASYGLLSGVSLGSLGVVLLNGFYLVLLFVGLLGPGLVIGLAQYRQMRPWITRPRMWVGWSAGGLALISLAAFFLLAVALILPLLSPALTQLGYPITSPELIETMQGEAVRLGMIGGSAAGLPHGLLFGLLQSIWLRSGKRQWWLASTITWVLVWTAAGIWFALSAIDLYSLYRPY